MGAIDAENRLKVLLKLEGHHSAAKNADSGKKVKTDSSSAAKEGKAPHHSITEYYQSVNPKTLSQFQSLFQEKRAELLAAKKSQVQKPTKGKAPESKPAPTIAVNLERNFTEQVASKLTQDE